MVDFDFRFGPKLLFFSLLLQVFELMVLILLFDLFIAELERFLVLLLNGQVTLLILFRLQAGVYSVAFLEKWLLSVIPDKISLVTIERVFDQEIVFMVGDVGSLLVSLLLLLLHPRLDLSPLLLLLGFDLLFIVLFLFGCLLIRLGQ